MEMQNSRYELWAKYQDLSFYTINHGLRLGLLRKPNLSLKLRFLLSTVQDLYLHPFSHESMKGRSA